MAFCPSGCYLGHELTMAPAMQMLIPTWLGLGSVWHRVSSCPRRVRIQLRLGRNLGRAGLSSILEKCSSHTLSTGDNFGHGVMNDSAITPHQTVCHQGHRVLCVRSVRFLTRRDVTIETVEYTLAHCRMPVPLPRASLHIELFNLIISRVRPPEFIVTKLIQPCYIGQSLHRRRLLL